MAATLEQTAEQILASLGRLPMSGLGGYYVLTVLTVLVVIAGVLALARRADESARQMQAVLPAAPPRPTEPPAFHIVSAPNLPAAPAAPRAPPAERAVPVLVADDSAVARAKLRKLLEGAGFEVDVANDGEQVLDLVARKPYAVLITDLEMPVLDGFQVIAHVQGSLETEDLPIIAITGHDELSARVHDCQGLYGIFRKPWNDRELLRRVSTVARLRGAVTVG
jgi:CheY-like chemotaxis protein